MAESSNENYKVPIGLRPLLEAFVRETLRTQPTDLVSFSILFFNVLQKHRKRNNTFIHHQTRIDSSKLENSNMAKLEKKSLIGNKFG
ncbi:unnamed protein product [Brugia pahangi]|uniref:RIIa domain-containing protein n=1 Tax=Brugia pahangi TaxID=6280 RepID=A0A0N4TS59_BRUPA|nr:unnamed protein product [Brugia pahangi]